MKPYWIDHGKVPERPPEPERKELCFRCVEKLVEVRNLKRLEDDRAVKITCAECGRKTYAGGTYIIGLKRRGRYS